MRAQAHHKTARLIVTALAAALTLTVIGGAAGATVASSKPRSPATVFERFAFELEVRLTAGENADVTVMTEGQFVGPNAQECAATVSLGPGLTDRRRAVVIGPLTWIDEGDGLRKSRKSAFDWQAECPSSPRFWADFPLTDVPSVPGTTETRGGIKVEHIDLTDTGDVDALGFFDGLTPDVAAERASIWVSKRHGVLVGLDFSVRGASEGACREILEQQTGDAATTSCAMELRLDLTEIDDPDVKIRGGRGSNGRVIRA